jgi:hypothetical protein
METIKFLRLKPGATCPECQEEQVHRVKRRDWMRWVPRSSYYKCAGCQARFLALYWLAISLPKGGKSVKRTENPV